jgi:surface protein
VLLNIYDNSRFVGSQVSHVVVLVFGCGLFETGPCCCCLCGGFGLSLFFVAPFSLLAVFEGASAFNQDVSTWNTGAVTNMRYSKCTLSPSLLATAPSVVVCC